jgi:hypothetical protein
MGPWQDEQHVEIAAPADMVFRYLADFAAHPAWSEATATVEPPAAGSFIVGAEFGLIGSAWEARSDEAIEDWEFIVLPSATATTLGLRLTVQPRKPLRWLVRDRWHTSDLAAQNLVSLAMIKAILEASLHEDDA